MQFEIKNSILQEYLRISKMIHDECTIHINNDEWRTVMTDMSNTRMIDIRILKDSFDVYETDNMDSNIIFRVDNILKAITNHSIDDIIKINIKDNNKIIIKYDTHRYVIRNMDQENKRINEVPSFSYNSKIMIGNDEFSKMLKSFDVLKKEARIAMILTNKDFILYGNNGMDIVIDIRVPHDMLYHIEHDNSNIYSVYNIAYILEFIKKLSRFATITISLGNEYPLRINCYDNNIDISYLIAPVIEKISLKNIINNTDEFVFSSDEEENIDEISEENASSATSIVSYLRDMGIYDSENMTSQIKKFLEDYPYWMEREDQCREVRRYLYKILIKSGIEDVDRLPNIVQNLMDCLKNDETIFSTTNETYVDENKVKIEDVYML